MEWIIVLLLGLIVMLLGLIFSRLDLDRPSWKSRQCMCNSNGPCLHHENHGGWTPVGLLDWYTKGTPLGSFGGRDDDFMCECCEITFSKHGQSDKNGICVRCREQEIGEELDNKYADHPDA